jgi:myo-inositol 2-dehydrogenase/D-chiro-inositol 1-dehydrogenase
MEVYCAADLSAERNEPIDLPLSNQSLSGIAEIVAARR